MSVELEPDKQVTTVNVLYYFWKLLYMGRSGLSVDTITSNNFFYSRQFYFRLWKRFSGADIRSVVYVYAGICGINRWDAQICEVHGFIVVK